MKHIYVVRMKVYGAPIIAFDDADEAEFFAKNVGGECIEVQLVEDNAPAFRSGVYLNVNDCEKGVADDD